jgi:hypothetical protein
MEDKKKQPVSNAIGLSAQKNELAEKNASEGAVKVRKSILIKYHRRTH